MKQWALPIGLGLLLSCNPDAPSVDGRRAAPPAAAEEASSASRPPINRLAVPDFEGWIACGGGPTAGKGADLGAAYADLLAPLVLNAGIAGEPLPGLLDRLPVLLARRPGGLILEIGAEDATRKAPARQFKSYLRQLETLLSRESRLALVIIISTDAPAYRKPIESAAVRMGAEVLEGVPLLGPRAFEAHQQMAEALRPMVEE